MSWLHIVSSGDRRWRLASKLNSPAADVEMKSENIIAKTISNSLSISGGWSEKKGSGFEPRGVVWFLMMTMRWVGFFLVGMCDNRALS